MAMRRTNLLLVLATALLLAFGAGCGDTTYVGVPGPAGPPGQDGQDGQDGGGAMADDGTSVEACIECHGENGAVPAFDIRDQNDVHYIGDVNSDGRLTPSGYRQLNVTINSVNVTGTNVVIDFRVTDEDGTGVDDIFADDGRFTISKLIPPGLNTNDPTMWQSLMNLVEDPGIVGDGPGTPELQATYERFTQTGGVFSNDNGGDYTYTSAYDPSSPTDPVDLPVVDGETMRVAIQISAGDIPPGNGWCDFDADTSSINNDCDSASLTRDIVRTFVCNDCHGATDEVQLGIHGGGRTDVEYCVTCHNPGTTDANSGNSVDMTIMTHKIHAGASLTDGYKIWGFRNSLHDYSHVNFTAELGDCTFCHRGPGADRYNWADVPSREACGSCHDDVNFDTGENHGQGGVQPNNQFCKNCHPDVSAPGRVQLAVREVHTGEARNTEAATYTGGNNGYLIEDMSFDPSTNEMAVDYSVTKAGSVLPMDLATAPEWTAAGGASRLVVSVAWTTVPDYTNEGSGVTPALPVSVNALPSGGGATAIGGNVFRVLVPIPGAFGTATATLDGHPAADLDGDGTLSDRIGVKNAFLELTVENRGNTVPRRDVVDVGLCNRCHDTGRQGVSLHGYNRTAEIQVCVACHTPDSTDINRRPADPNDTTDGRREQAIDMKRMIHQIHAGSSLQEKIVIWGFGFPGTEHDFSHVSFIGNLGNCETCHYDDTYGTEAAWNSLSTTMDTGAEADDPSDDLNISSVASVCSGCHDDDVAKGHMLEQGASFKALDQDIH